MNLTESIWKNDIALALDNDIITNLDLSDNVIAVYVTLRTIYNRQMGDMYVDINILNSVIYNKFTKPTQRVRERLTKTMNELSDYCQSKYGIGFEVIRGGNSTYLIPECFIGAELKSCTYVERSAIRRILSAKEEYNIDPFALLRMYLYMVYRMTNKGYYSGKSRKHKSDYVNYAKLRKIDVMDGTNFLVGRTKRYMDFLELKNIIAVYRCRVVYYRPNSTLIPLPNLYARYSDKEKLDMYGKRRDNALADTYGKGGGVYRMMERSEEEIKIRTVLGRHFHRLTVDFDTWTQKLDRDVINEVYEYAKGRNDDLRYKIKMAEESGKLSAPKKQTVIKGFIKSFKNEDTIKKLKEFLQIEDDDSESDVQNLIAEELEVEPTEDVSVNIEADDFDCVRVTV